MRVTVGADEIDGWCLRRLGAGIETVLFTEGHLSHVAGVRLRDGREVVVKVRPSHPRLAGCTAVQRALWRVGYPCPEPLAGPLPLAGYAANAEVLVPAGEILPIDDGAVECYADLLARLIRSAPPAAVIPNPPWVAWDHRDGGIWPVPDDRDVDLNAYPESAWLDEIGLRVQRRLAAMPPVPPVVGHGDWEAQNLRFHGRQPWVVHDWDSVISAPEAVVVGLAASVWTCGAEPRAASVEESQAFIDAYQHAAGRRWSSAETEASWAAGLWVYAFNAKKAILDGSAWLSEAEAVARLKRASA
ncbi:MAG TPA: hypothetical protein VGF84_00025 [Micromonosporaceae bacterium]|jgi:hypothetical protein